MPLLHWCLLRRGINIMGSTAGRSKASRASGTVSGHLVLGWVLLWNLRFVFHPLLFVELSGVVSRLHTVSTWARGQAEQQLSGMGVRGSMATGWQCCGAPRRRHQCFLVYCFEALTTQRNMKALLRVQPTTLLVWDPYVL